MLMIEKSLFSLANYLTVCSDESRLPVNCSLPEYMLPLGYLEESAQFLWNMLAFL
jgi:hypothetical protein